MTDEVRRNLRHMYVTKGINREKVMQDAVKSSFEGETDVMVHIHSSTERCDGGHYFYSEGVQTQAW